MQFMGGIENNTDFLSIQLEKIFIINSHWIGFVKSEGSLFAELHSDTWGKNIVKDKGKQMC